jgi:hypothetical protein
MKQNVAKAIEKAMAGITTEDLMRRPRKTARIPLRLTSGDKNGIEKAAQELHLSVSDYLILLHRYASHALGI